MLYLVKNLGSYERIKSRPNKGLYVMFQGKKLQPCQYWNYQFRWGPYGFDIRELRDPWGKRVQKVADVSIKSGEISAWFYAAAKEIMDLVGETPLKDAFAKSNNIKSKQDGFSNEGTTLPI